MSELANEAIFLWMPRKQNVLVDVWCFSKAVLRDRNARRRFLAQLVIVVLTLFILGNWPLRDWVDASKIRFITWWGMTGFITIWMMLLALYDALRIRRELLEEEEGP